MPNSQSSLDDKISCEFPEWKRVTDDKNDEFGLCPRCGRKIKISKQSLSGVRKHDKLCSENSLKSNGRGKKRPHSADIQAAFDDLDDLIWEAESDSDEEDIDEGMDYSWFEGVHTGKTTRLSRQWVSTLRKARNNSRFLRQSNLAVDLLRACAEQQNKKCSIPPRDVVTRWNSTYYLLDWYRTNRCVFDDYQRQCLKRGRGDSLYSHCKKYQLLAGDYEVVEDLTETLSYFVDATKLFSATKFSTLGMIRPVIAGLLSILEDVQGGRGRRHKIRQSLAGGVRKYFAEFLADNTTVGKLCTCAAYLSPQVADTEREDVAQAAVRDCMEVFGIEDRVMTFPERDEDQGGTCNLQSRCDLLKRVKRREPCIRQEDMSTVTREFQVYERLLASRNAEAVPSNPLEFWKVTPELPTLSRVAFEVLSIPSGSVACEEMFSVSGNLSRNRRSRLSDSMLRSIMLLKEY